MEESKDVSCVEVENSVVVETSPEKSRFVANLAAPLGWWSTNWLSWTRYSESMIRNLERKILQYCTTKYRGLFVDVGPVVGSSDRIWTISLNTESRKTPLVLLHGLGAGVALWCLNLDYFAKNRPVYAMDILGFGRSTRPSFSSKALEAEEQLVKSIEEWRKEMKLERFILLGHSMGGFLAASYAIKYPDRVKHLILADPWGFPEKPNKHPEVPLWVRTIAYTLQPLNPLWAVRAAGPWGQWLIGRVRPDIQRKFSGFIKDETLITQYIYQCNAQPPSGESAFHAMMSQFGWAKHPMVNRIDKLDEKVPITLLYGARSWVDNTAGEIVKQKRMKSYVNLQSIPGAGHHVYADKPDTFNKLVTTACDESDVNDNLRLELTAMSIEKTESEEEVEENKPEYSTTPKV